MLLLLDLDGLFFVRTSDKRTDTSDYKSFVHKKYKYIIYPGALEFLDRCAELYDIAIYSSITDNNIFHIIDKLFYNRKHKIKFVLDRKYTKLDPGYELINNIKAFDTIKSISDIVSNPIINVNRTYKLNDTIIVDDSYNKVRFNNHDNVIIYKSDFTFDIDMSSYNKNIFIIPENVSIAYNYDDILYYINEKHNN